VHPTGRRAAECRSSRGSSIQPSAQTGAIDLQPSCATASSRNTRSHARCNRL
jgi:hypothetical protein